MDLAPHQVLFVSGIGQAAKAPHYLNANVFNGLHGRALPVATGRQDRQPGPDRHRRERRRLHLRRGRQPLPGGHPAQHRPDAHRPQQPGLRPHQGPGQPDEHGGVRHQGPAAGGHVRALQSRGRGTVMGANFVARGFSGMPDHLRDLIAQAIAHPGFALVDVLQPCVSFNKVNTFCLVQGTCQRAWSPVMTRPIIRPR